MHDLAKRMGPALTVAPQPMAALPLPLPKRGVSGACVACFSFGSIMLASRTDRVGEGTALRESSTVNAALIGGWLSGEKVGRAQVALMGLIAVGAVVMESAG